MYARQHKKDTKRKFLNLKNSKNIYFYADNKLNEEKTFCFALHICV